MKFNLFNVAGFYGKLEFLSNQQETLYKGSSETYTQSSPKPTGSPIGFPNFLMRKFFIITKWFTTIFSCFGSQYDNIINIVVYYTTVKLWSWYTIKTSLSEACSDVSQKLSYTFNSANKTPPHIVSLDPDFIN
jgi:hypothetical protein